MLTWRNGLQRSDMTGILKEYKKWESGRLRAVPKAFWAVPV
jgi:hypothetical protein